MAMIDALLPEFEHEMANTRRVLERVPDDRLDWRPHPKSWTMGALATHLATLPSWTAETMNRTELDLAPVGQPAPPSPVQAKTREELLARFDGHLNSARAALAGVSDAAMLENWTLLSGGKQILRLPRAAVLRSFVLSHTIHHRAQLGVYLRLNDIPVPAIYGPSADESGF
jgi:uncharacterized damage-inducible protein DinB